MLKYIIEHCMCWELIWNSGYLFFSRNPGSSHRRTEWKPYGTPLVSSISCDDTVTRGDILSVIHTVPSPLLRTQNLRHADVFDISTTGSDPPRAVNCTGASTGSILGESKQESGYSNVTTLRKLPLLLVDENNACILISQLEKRRSLKLPHLRDR